MTDTTPAPTYGVIESEFGDGDYHYLGSDEILWDWAASAIDVPFVDHVAHIPLPEGYVLIEQPGQDTKVFNPNDGMPDGINDLNGAETTVTVTSGSAMDDKIHVLILAMQSVKPRDYYNANLPEDRLLETVAY